jgi:peptidoglycan/LPS O-acetylase OafA/YrhL
LSTLAYVLAIATIKLKGLDVLPYMDNLQIGSAFLVAMLYTVIQSNPIKVNFIRNIVSELAKYSFGIYLIHIVVRNIVWTLFQSSTIHPFPETFLIAAITMAASYSIIKLISYLPFSKYTIGV